MKKKYKDVDTLQNCFGKYDQVFPNNYFLGHPVFNL